jgi:beta-N-acetylhexosaminidase
MKTQELKKIVGSLLIVGFDGTRLSDSAKNFLEQWNLGGVILFKRNIESLEQAAALNEAVYRTARVTPIVSVDHEGGRVSRLSEPFTQFPAMGKLGEVCRKRGDFQLAEQVGEAFGRELRASGFNLDWAPVLDVNSNPKNPVIGDRAFGADPEAVTEAALAFLRGLEFAGVAGCGKHFPGHGDTAEDSHHTLPQVAKDEAELWACELKPFERAVARGIPMLMTAHVRYPALDAEWPATLSEKILQGILRHKMGFQGLVVSDDMFMKGITSGWSLEEACERFLKVGGDLLLLCHQESAQRRAAAHLIHRAEQDGDFLKLLEAKSKQVDAWRGRLQKGGEAAALAKYSEKHRKLAQSFS